MIIMTIVVVYYSVFSNTFINLKVFYSHLIDKVILYITYNFLGLKFMIS